MSVCVCVCVCVFVYTCVCMGVLFTESVIRQATSVQDFTVNNL